MIDLSVKYMGFNLKNPIIIASSGLTDSVEKIKELEKNNAAAVVLKSLFEEQIMIDTYHRIKSSGSDYTDAFDYLNTYTKQHSISNYLKLISDAKKSVDIPIIASVNCASDSEWINFAGKIESAGADALEINVSFLPVDENISCTDYEKKYFSIIKKVKSKISIPLSLKMSYYSSGLAHLIKNLIWTDNVDSFVLFNRFYQPDIDIDNFKIRASNMFTSSNDISTSLRWIAILSGKLDAEFVATTGVHSGEDVIKQLLAGATAVQIASAIYKHGPEYISEILKSVEKWMINKNFSQLNDFRGKLKYNKELYNSAYERTQFLKYYGSE